MARFEDDEFDYGSLPEVQQQEFLYDLIGFSQAPRDYEAHTLFWDLMYNDDLTISERLDKYDELSDYLWAEYGLSFEDIWNWDDFRGWYESQ